MRQQRALLVAAVLSAAATGFLIVQLAGQARTTELYQPNLNAIDVDNARDFGPLIYAAIQEDANNGLQYSVEAGKAQVERYRQAMIDDAMKQASASADRFADACYRNPSLPGCNDMSDNKFPEYANPLKPPPGVDIYAYAVDDTQHRLNRQIENGQWDNKMERYMQDIDRYKREIVAKQRMEDACMRNPQLPGCKVNIIVQPPTWPRDGPPQNKYVYAATEQETEAFLNNEMRKAHIQDRIDRAEQQYEAAIQYAAAEQRWKDACARNPSLPGCDGGWA